MKNKYVIGLLGLLAILTILYFFGFFSSNDKKNDEEITVSSSDNSDFSNDSLSNSITGNATMQQIATYPSKVILTGLAEHRLVSIYKSKQKTENDNLDRISYKAYKEESTDEFYGHFMPGIDILFGYNLLNIAHYDLKTEKGNYLFNHPVLVKTLYYPSFAQDSIDKKPINRNYYLMSVYDQDTNNDSLVNKVDLRKFYHFDASTQIKTQIIPNNYSVVRSQYDSKNDLMYIFAVLDTNKNGSAEKSEPLHVFWLSLQSPAKAKLLY